MMKMTVQVGQLNEEQISGSANAKSKHKMIVVILCNNSLLYRTLNTNAHLYSSENILRKEIK